MITVIGGNKGGSGKTTTAVNLAIGLALRGKDVCLVNGDLQRTAAKHLAEREAAEVQPAITLIEKFDNLTQTLRALDEKYEHVIVDVAGRNSREFITSGVVAHQIIAPLQCSQPDLDTLIELQQQVEGMRNLNPDLKVYCLQSMATTNPVLRGNERKEFLEYLDEFPSIKTLESVICFRKVYRDCMSTGLGVLETDNATAKSEMEKLMEEVFG
ncbi:AAA family ATPase [Salmonella enterica subsp. diarizonae]|uniref:AAA family ATPase n=2 Tax=Salmonella enterica TaxID=28901 RepID=A0A759WKM3_SALER|nr:chromosome partitioning protein ParA [Salmonella enterica subsp. diarizonae]EGV7463578.1 chromosome partitioning protein ParA [Salmonella enterica]EIM5530195.1 AAA family ATPase [Salmonella enterica subsp. enterica]ECG8656180.1 AAA family ATPase [Salmonella enterica subsp. diarizonae]EDV3465771.1 AAA family ATPase [Salmonella enterica subsp. diarizonae]